MWRARDGRTRVACTLCHVGHLALEVGHELQYRWSCVRCGWLSSWFRVTGRGGRVRIVPSAVVTFTNPSAPTSRRG